MIATKVITIIYPLKNQLFVSINPSCRIYKGCIFSGVPYLLRGIFPECSCRRKVATHKQNVHNWKINHSVNQKDLLWIRRYYQFLVWGRPFCVCSILDFKFNELQSTLSPNWEFFGKSASSIQRKPKDRGTFSFFFQWLRIKSASFGERNKSIGEKGCKVVSHQNANQTLRKCC